MHTNGQDENTDDAVAIKEMGSRSFFSMLLFNVSIKYNLLEGLSG